MTDLDFTEEDRGGYRPHPATETVLESLRMIKYQSARHLCANTKLPLDGILAVVEYDERIGMKLVGSVSVYFLKENEPNGRLYITGDNQFGLEETQNGKASVKTVAATVKKELKQTAPTLRQRLAAKAGEIETMAAEGKSLKTICEEFGVKASTVQTGISKGVLPEAKAAWERGLSKRVKARKASSPEKPDNCSEKPNGSKAIEKPATSADFGERFEAIAVREAMPEAVENFSQLASFGKAAREAGERLFETITNNEALMEAVRKYGQPERVDHPAHYNRHPSGVECIDVVEHMSFNLGNAIKYIWRSDEKGSPIEDLEKAEWYIRREIERRSRNA